jgi:CheY-like chemotaxis protein
LISGHLIDNRLPNRRLFGVCGLGVGEFYIQDGNPSHQGQGRAASDWRNGGADWRVKAAALAQQAVLVMDDEELIRKVAGKMLEFLGYQAILARDGEEAIALCRARNSAQAPILAAILDWHIPGGMDGLETWRRLHALDPALHGILSSGEPAADQEDSRARAGLAAIMAKPYELKTLRETLERLPGRAA